MAAGPPSLPQPINFSDNAADDKPLSSACSMSDEIKRQVHIKRAFTKLRDDITAEPSTSSVEEAGRAAEPEEHAAGCTLWLEPEWCSRSSQSGAAGADAEDGGLFKFKQMIRGIHSSAPPDDDAAADDDAAEGGAAADEDQAADAVGAEDEAAADEEERQRRRRQFLMAA